MQLDELDKLALALARKHRLSKKDFDRVFKNGETVRGSFFFVRFKNNGLNYSRVAVVVPTRVSKKSVVRNRIKRVVSEVLYQSRLLKKSSDVVVIILSNIVGRPFEEIKREIEQTIKKVLAI